MSFELIAFLAYMFFLYGMMMAVNNLQRYTLQPTTEEVIQEVLYNLRNLPRVNYKEESSDEEEENEEEEEREVSGEEEPEEHKEETTNSEVVQTLGRPCEWPDSEREEGELSEEEIQPPVRRTGLVKRRRETNPVGRILDCVD